MLSPTPVEASILKVHIWNSQQIIWIRIRIKNLHNNASPHECHVTFDLENGQH